MSPNQSGSPLPADLPRPRRRSELTPPASETYNGRGRCGCALRVARKVILLSACQRPGHQLKGSEGAEEDVPATAHPPQAQAWLPPPDADARRPGGAGGTAAEGALEADGIEREEADPALIRRLMIARALRLRRPFEFERVRKQGRSWATPLVVMAVLPNDLEHNRYGFAVGRRIGKAAARNRVKRWMREAVRHLHPRLRQGYDIVFIARGAVASPDVTYHQIFDAITTLTARAKLQTAAPVPPASDTRGTPE